VARAQSLFDEGTWKELAGPFDRIESRWLAKQGIAPQSDDGLHRDQGEKSADLQQSPLGFEGAFQGWQRWRGIRRQDDRCPGSCHEGFPRREKTDSCSSFARDRRCAPSGSETLVLAAVAEIISSAIALRQHAPMITIVAGTVGCFRRHVSCSWRVQLHNHDARSPTWIERPRGD